MSVIQSIREKYAKWAVIAIALALLGFILTDYFTAKNRMFGGGNSTTVGVVNGKKIDYINFETRLKAIDEQMQSQARQQGREVSEAERYQNNEQLWNQEVEQVIMGAEFKKVGIDVGNKEFNEWLFGQNPPMDLRQRFSDQQGNYDGAAAQNAINQMKRSTSQAEKDQLNAYLSTLEYSRKLEKYNALINNSVYYPKWFIEKQNAESALLAKVSYIAYPYSNVKDSISVSDKEIEEFVSKNKEQFKQEEARSIAYVVFDAAATPTDSAASKKQLADMKAEFAAAPDPGIFLSRYGSAMDFYDGYVGKSLIQVPEKDSILALAKNAVFGPYLDQNSYVMAKMIDTKNMPDSVKVRHILIQTYAPQTQQQMLDDSTAKKRIDSIEVAIKGGARFDSLAAKYSDDKGSGANGGIVPNPQNPATNYFTAGTMVKEFNDFSFEGKTGDKKIVKTVFGYHYIEILDQKNFQPHYKVAYFAKNIIATDETEQRVLEEASKFASESEDMKKFEATIAKNKYKKLEATNIKPNDISIQGLFNMGFGQAVTCRPLIREIYKADKGDVLKQERIGDTRIGYKYVVAAVTDIFKEGLQPARVARPRVEPVLVNKKKAELVKKTLGKITTLEAAAAILKDSIITVDSVRMETRNRFGFDAKVVGAVFNPDNKGKVISEPLAGDQKLFIVRVDDTRTTSVIAGDLEQQKAKLRQDTRGMQGQYSAPISVMRKTATIKDNRRNFY